MLDGMTLDQKLTVASQWFARSRTGEFDLTSDSQALRFGALLAECQREAYAAAVEDHIEAALRQVLERRLAVLGIALPPMPLSMAPANRNERLEAPAATKPTQTHPNDPHGGRHA